MLPEVGSCVWIEFEGGDVSYPIWAGMFWASGDIPSQASATVKAVITAGGSIALDDNAGSITMTDAQQNTVVLDSSGVTSTSGSSSVAIGASGVNVNSGALEVL
jgi:acid phosphatase family membrane protein YuiD